MSASRPAAASLKRATRSLLLGVAGALLGLTVLGGVLHTSAGRPLLHKLAQLGGCPVDFDGGSPTRIEAFRRAQFGKRAGALPARSHLARDFELGVSSIDEVQAWARSGGLACASARHGSVLRCRDAASGEDLHFQFDERQRLVALDVLHAPDCAGAASEQLARLSQSVSQRVGEPTSASGEPTARYLGEARYRRAGVEYRYAHYVAKLSATHLDPGVVTVREQYQWHP